MAHEPINRPFGYLRETSAMATGHDASTGLNRTGLDVYLATIFPGVEFIHDKPLGGKDNDLRQKGYKHAIYRVIYRQFDKKVL